ncbi:hypothetical protein [Natrinema sp. 74]|uniref:DUF7537 family lipoprotein n=1 Tax=Natrinema sp. 74 TaxID=3384159 RepID=UPI0038D414BC
MDGNRTATRRRWLRGCGSLGAVGLAGCLGDSTDGPDADETDDLESGSLTFPAGVTADGIGDPAALFEGHRNALTATSFTADYTTRRRWTSRGGRSTTQLMAAFELWADPDAERVEKVTYDHDGSGDREMDRGIYIDGDRGATSGNEPVTQRTAEGVIETAFDPLSDWLRCVESEYDGIGTIDGERIHRIRVTEIDAAGVPGDGVTDEGTLLVDEDGRLRSVRLRQSETRADTLVTFEVRFTCHGFGETTVDEPEWVDELERAGVTAVELEPGTRIDLSAQTSAWVGLKPEPIAGLENPPLALESGESYAIGWSEGDGAVHNLALRDETEEVVGGLETELTTDPAGAQWLEFVASDELAGYACEPHAPTMNGDIEIR